MAHYETDKPKSANLKDFVGKPVIIEPLQELKSPDPKWTTVPWEVFCWYDEGNGYEAISMLVFAKAIVDVCKKMKKGDWLGGVIQAQGSQLWIDSSNPLITKALESEWEKISGSEK